MMSTKKLVFAEVQFSRKLRFKFVFMTILFLMKGLDYPMTELENIYLTLVHDI